MSSFYSFFSISLLAIDIWFIDYFKISSFLFILDFFYNIFYFCLKFWIFFKLTDCSRIDFGFLPFIYPWALATCPHSGLNLFDAWLLIISAIALMWKPTLDLNFYLIFLIPFILFKLSWRKPSLPYFSSSFIEISFKLGVNPEIDK